MKKRSNSITAALVAFTIFGATMLSLSRESVSFAARDNTEGAGSLGRGRWVKQTQAPETQPAAPAVDAPQSDAALADDSLSDILNKKVIRFEVSENAKRFIFDETPRFDDGAPAYGNEFVTEGYMYPAGTLNGSNGVNLDGSSEFPDKVIGIWTCRGWHVGEGAKTATGPWVITHQLYDFGTTPGKISITTDGYELVDLNLPIERAIIGGTGQFAQARGKAVQTMVGFNQINGVVLQYELRAVTK